MDRVGGRVSWARRAGSWRSGHWAPPVWRIGFVADLRQQRLDRATAGQMQQDPVFVLFDAGGDLEQREHDGPGLSRRQRRALQTQAAQLLVQDTLKNRFQTFP